MKILAADESIRKALSRNSRDYVSKVHDPDKVARDYCSFVNGVLGGDELAISELASRLEEMDIDEDEITQYVLSKARGII
jgi:hypothetical protein